MSSYPTRKQQFPGKGVILAEFLAVASPEQVALYEATMAAPALDGIATDWVSNDYDAKWGLWRLEMGRDTVVMEFNRATRLVWVAS